MQQGGNVADVYKRLVNVTNQLEEKLTFAKKDGNGYLTFCPTNLVPKLAAANQLNGICAKFNLQPRGTHGEHTESEGGVYDISKKRRLGLSEIEAIQEMRKGVQAVIETEKK